MNEEWRKATRQEKGVGSLFTAPCSCPWRPGRLMAPWRFDSTVAIRSPMIREQTVLFGEQTAPFGEQTLPFGERTLPFGERKPPIFDRFAGLPTVRERKPPNPRAKGNQWGAKSAGFRPFCQTLKDLHERSTKKIIAHPGHAAKSHQSASAVCQSGVFMDGSRSARAATVRARCLPLADARGSETSRLPWMQNGESR